MSLAARLPIPRSLRVEALLLAEDGLAILASSEATDVRCPLCGRRSDRVHSRYARTLADLPWADVAVKLRCSLCSWWIIRPPSAPQLTAATS